MQKDNILLIHVLALGSILHTDLAVNNGSNNFLDVTKVVEYGEGDLLLLAVPDQIYCLLALVVLLSHSIQSRCSRLQSITLQNVSKK